MWTREELKSKAKSVLKGTYWIGFAVCLVAGIIDGLFNGFTSMYNSFQNMSTNITMTANSTTDPTQVLTEMMDKLQKQYTSPTFLVLLVLGLVYGLLVTNVIGVGKNRYFLSARETKGDISELFYGFKRYGNVVKTTAWQYLFTLLWSLLTFLFIIPGIVMGIIKGIAYSMTPYILAENPNINYRRALKMSIEMTKGHKGEIFVLYLSFIGWYLLGFVLCCVGMLFVNPYFEATKAELYITLRNEALQKGIISPDEVNLVPVQVNPINPDLNTPWGN